MQPTLQPDDPVRMGNPLLESAIAPECPIAPWCETLSPQQIQCLSPSALAYLGDAVYELLVRRYYLTPPKRIQTYHQQVVSQVRAERQADQLRALLPYLTPTEHEWVKRGRNAATGKPKRIDPDTYQQATSLETLIGYLYLSDRARLQVILTYLEFDPPVPCSPPATGAMTQTH